MIEENPVKPSKDLAALGFIMGICSLLIYPFAFIFGILGITLNIIVIIKPKKYIGKGIAITGLVLSILGVFVHACYIVWIGLVYWYHHAEF